MRVAHRLLFLPFLLSGCAGLDLSAGTATWPWLNLVADPVAAPVAAGGASIESAQFNFDWSLAGDRDVMPVQVFDDGQRMWLQFASGGAVPALFKVTPSGRTPLSFRHESPYLILEGVHPHLELRGGHLSGTIRRVNPAEGLPASLGSDVLGSITQSGSEAEAGGGMGAETGVEVAVVDSTAANESEILSLKLASIAESVGMGKRPAAAVEVAVPVTAVPGTAVQVGSVVPSGSAPAEPEMTMRVAAPLPGSQEESPALYAVSPADGTMRQALSRWSENSGWTFAPEHWAVDVDIPLVGSATFLTDFKSAVRELVAATEMGDRPLQPCFYANRVLRVVPIAQPCDRRNGMGVLS